MEYLRTDTVSVGTLYRKAAKLSRGAGVCFCKHFVPAGAQGAVACRPCRCGVRRGAWRFWSPACPAFPEAAGGAWRFWSPAYPAFSLLSFPHPPAPLPGGKGENQGYFMQGASPLASPGLNPRGTSYPRRLRPRRGGVPPPGTCTAGTVSAANGLMQGCRGRSPRRNKVKIAPFPGGEGGWGDGGKKAN